MTTPTDPPAPSSSPEDSLLERTKRFFFAEEVPYGAAVVRIALPLPLLFDALLRWPHARELYSADGAPAALWHTYGLPNALPELPGWAAVGLFTLYVLSLVGAAAGWRARLNCALAAAGCFYFGNLDAIGSLTKYNVIATHLLVLLSLSRCGEVWSADAWAARRAAAANGGAWSPRRFAAWPRRLMQLHIGLVYFGAAFTKLHMADFFSGEQLTYWMVTHVNRAHPLGPFMAENPLILQIGGYASCVWEVSFVLIAWRGWGRRVALALGVQFHLMTTLTLGLYLFPQVCLAAYWAFLNEEDVAYFRAKFAALRSKLPAVSLPTVSLPALSPRAVRWGYLAFAPAVVLIGVGAEHRADPYGERRPEGPMRLRTVDPALVRAMTGPYRPPRARDLVWDFDLGTTLVGENLLGRYDTFRRGSTVLSQAWLSPPHDDVVLECAFRHGDGPDGRGPVIERRKAVLARSGARYTFAWGLDESLKPGPYRVTLSVDGQPVADEFFTLTVD